MNAARGKISSRSFFERRLRRNRNSSMPCGVERMASSASYAALQNSSPSRKRLSSDSRPAIGISRAFLGSAQHRVERRGSVEQCLVRSPLLDGTPRGARSLCVSPRGSGEGWHRAGWQLDWNEESGREEVVLAGLVDHPKQCARLCLRVIYDPITLAR